MAGVNYYAIAEAISACIQSNVPNLQDRVFIEEEMPPGHDLNPSVSIMITGRRVPEDRQTLNAGTELLYVVDATIVVYAVSLEHMRKAIEIRDDYLGEIERVLLANITTLGSGIDIAWLDGGTLETARTAEGIYAAGEISLRLEVTGTN